MYPLLLLLLNICYKTWKFPKIKKLVSKKLRNFYLNFGQKLRNFYEKIFKAVKYVHVRVYESNTYTYYRQLFDEWESSTYWNSIRQIQKSRLRNAQIWVDFWKRDDNQKVVTSDVFYMQLNI